jgi:hypothetical protein
MKNRSGQDGGTNEVFEIWPELASVTRIDFPRFYIRNVSVIISELFNKLLQ